MYLDRESLSGKEGKIEMPLNINTMATDSGTGGIYGVNKQNVINTIDAVIASYNVLSKNLLDDMQTDFIDVVARSWYSPAANDTMTKYAKNMMDFMGGVYRTYLSISNALSSSAEAILKEQGDAAATVTPSKTYSAPTVLSAELVLEQDDSGNVKMDVTTLQTALTTLKNLKLTAILEIDKTKGLVSNSGFIGGTMQTSLENSLDSIQQNISTSLNSVNDSIVAAIGEYKSGLVKTVGNIQTNFTVSGGEGGNAGGVGSQSNSFNVENN